MFPSTSCGTGILQLKSVYATIFVINISESRLVNNHFTADSHTNGTFSKIFAMITHNIVRHEVSNFLVTYNVDVKYKIFTKSTRVKVAECPTYLKQYWPKDRC